MSTVPRTLPRLSDTARRMPSGPPPWTRRVRLAPSPLRALPIMDAAARVRPRAAVATGRGLWICRARSVSSRVVTATAFTIPSFVIARTN